MQWFCSFLTPNFNGYAFTSGLQITVNSIHRQKHLGICLPTVGSQTWVRSGWEFFHPSGESNPRPWRWIKSARDQHVKCNERPCHWAYYIRGSTPFHSCVEVRSPKLVSSGDWTGARAPSASYCSTEGVAPLHTAPPVPIYYICWYFRRAPIFYDFAWFCCCKYLCLFSVFIYASEYAPIFLAQLFWP